jgi:uncharacterized membrane protein
MLLANGWVDAASALYLGFHAACHQIPERSFHIDRYPFAVCARCTGVYVGLTAGIVLYPLLRTITRSDFPPRQWLFLAALPTTLDFALGVTGIVENTHLSRFLTALLLGVGVAFYVLPGLVSLGLTPWRQFFQSGSYAKG